MTVIAWNDRCRLLGVFYLIDHWDGFYVGTNRIVEGSSYDCIISLSDVQKGYQYRPYMRLNGCSRIVRQCLTGPSAGDLLCNRGDGVWDSRVRDFA